MTHAEILLEENVRRGPMSFGDFVKYGSEQGLSYPEISLAVVELESKEKIRQEGGVLVPVTDDSVPHPFGDMGGFHCHIPSVPSDKVMREVSEVFDKVVYPTGATRSSDGEDERFDLMSPIALKRISKTYHEGMVKRGRMNWEKGMAVTDLLNRSLRHIYEYLGGDRSEDHLGHAGWGIMAACHSEACWPHLNRDTLRGDGVVAPGCQGYKDPIDPPPSLTEEFQPMMDEAIGKAIRNGDCVS